MEEKMKIVNWLAANDYHFFGETLTHFAERFSLETLKCFQECYARRKGLTY